jgi:cytosine/adenosine deaminase-related metal-dependent hydrolase
LRYRAAWILPIDQPPIAGGTVTLERDVITAVGPFDGGAVEDLGNVAILPGLVNAHTHLELSWMRGRVPPRGSMPAWAASLMALRGAEQAATDRTENKATDHTDNTETDRTEDTGADAERAIVDAIREARAAGTCLVGDVTNSFAAYDALVDSELSAAIFRELIGFAAPDPEAVVAAVSAQIAELTPIAWLRPSIVPHAPYSVSAALMQASARWSAGKPFSIHLGESAQELEFLRDGTGEWRALLESLGVWSPSWTAPGCGPVAYLDRLGLVDERLLAVHGVQFTGAELSRLGSAGATVVTCPRSNQWTGAGVPPIDRFYASGVRVTIGTDSLASVGDLNLFAELAEVRRLTPAVPAARILESATLAGAQALGFADELGSIEGGKRAQLVAVRLPADVRDVEEYLLSGIEPRDIRWLDEP